MVENGSASSLEPDQIVSAPCDVEKASRQSKFVGSDVPAEQDHRTPLVLFCLLHVEEAGRVTGISIARAAASPIALKLHATR